MVAVRGCEAPPCQAPLDATEASYASYITWGPALWFFLHIVSFNYAEDPPIRKRANLASFFKFLSRIVPCPLLRELLGRMNTFSDKYEKTRESLSRFVHEIRAIRDGKNTPSYDDIKLLYEDRLQKM
jgi:hypothetical protein